MVHETSDRSVAAPRLLFVGLDAADPTLVTRWMDEGLLPNLAQLRESGLSGPTHTSPGLYTGALWPSFSTGLTPGRHGTYYEQQLVPGSYRIAARPPAEAGGAPFWDELARCGARVGVFDVPKSFVSPGGAALQICNWGTHDAETDPCSWPPALISEIEVRHGISPFRRCDWIARRTQSEKILLHALLRRIETKLQITTELLARGPWDLFLVAFGDSHCAGHQLWHLHDPAHPRHDARLAACLGDPLATVYRALDRAVGKILSQAGAATTAIVLCSHGMGAHYDATFLMDEILRRIEGRREPLSRALLDRARRLWRRLPVTLTESVHGLAKRIHHAPDAADRAMRRCFAVPTNANCAGIRINLRGREPAGRVAPGAEYDAFVAELTHELHQLVHPETGRPLVRQVLATAQLFPGERSHLLPDLLVQWNREVPIAGAVSPRIGWLAREDTGTRRSGDHRAGGLFLARGPGVAARRLHTPVATEDFAPTIAALLGVVLPDLDGTPIAALTAQVT